MSWFYLALLATLLYAIVNLFDDNLLSFVYESPYLSAVSAGLFGLLPLLSRFFIHAQALSPTLTLLSVGGGFLTLSYYFFYFKGLESESPSIVVALLGLAPATIPFLAYFIVHEHLTSAEILGFVIVLIAYLGLAVSNLRQLKFSKALLPVLIAVVLMDAATIMIKYAYQRAPFYPVYLYFSCGMGLGGIFFLLLRFDKNKAGIWKIKRQIKKLLPLFIITEMFGISAELTLNLAISRGPVSLVKVIEGIQPMFVLLIALALYPVSPKFFREAEDGKRFSKFPLMLVAIAGLAIISVASKA